MEIYDRYGVAIRVHDYVTSIAGYGYVVECITPEGEVVTEDGALFTKPHWLAVSMVDREQRAVAHGRNDPGHTHSAAARGVSDPCHTINAPGIETVAPIATGWGSVDTSTEDETPVYPQHVPVASMAGAEAQPQVGDEVVGTINPKFFGVVRGVCPNGSLLVIDEEGKSAGYTVGQWSDNRVAKTGLDPRLMAAESAVAWVATPHHVRIMKCAAAVTMEDPTQATAQAPKHVMGLDGEQIDMDAFRDFMRNL